MSNVINVPCFIFRRSANTNSFGLRGVQVITTGSRRVFEFAVDDIDAARYAVGEFAAVPFRVTADGQPSAPAHELARLIGTLKNGPAVEGFLRAGDPVLALKWATGRAAEAITAVTE